MAEVTVEFKGIGIATYEIDSEQRSHLMSILDLMINEKVYLHSAMEAMLYLSSRLKNTTEEDLISGGCEVQHIKLYKAIIDILPTVNGGDS